MLKIAIAEDYEDATVIENDRGNWKYVQTVHAAATSSYSFIGFGGENIITVHLMGMQNGKIDVVVVHNVCDNPIRVSHDCKKVGFTGHEEMNVFVNDLIATTCDYPEHIPGFDD